MTLEQIKKEIKEGKVPYIYYSSNTLWWTHLESDLEKSTKEGVKARDRSHKKLMRRGNIPNGEKSRINALYKMSCKGSHPLDPSGSPLMMTVEVHEWIEVAEQKPEHFGKHGLKAFMKSHHQNSNGICLETYDEYNNLIDG